MSAAKPKPFTNTDGDSLLSRDERLVFNAMAKHHKSVTGEQLTELQYADVALRGAARNFGEYADSTNLTKQSIYAQELRRAAVLYVRCALLASDNGLVESWIQGDAGPGTIQTLDDLRGDLP